jgi:SpoVK/Ycf46/Vps4 family AAA+-type ATPase
LIPPRGILLHGPPGCAKTTLARAAAGASGVAFLTLSPAEVYASSYVGEAEAVVRRAFSLARSSAPCILFFDELDSIFGGNESPCDGMGARGSSAEARVLSTFLNEMDGVDGSKDDGVLVLGATNRPWTLDSALLRPGRLGDKIIYVPPPDLLSRQSIIKRQLRYWVKTSSLDGIDVDQLSSDDVSGNMTGAEIVGACQDASMRLLRDFEDDNLLSITSALKETSPIHTNSGVLMKQEYLLESFAAVTPLLSKPHALDEFQIFKDRRSAPIQDR